MVDWLLASKISYNTALAASCIYAIVRGGVEERVAAAVAISASGATALVLPISDLLGIYGRYGFALVDVAVLAGFDAIMVRSRAFWPIWATGFQIVAVAMDAAMIVAPVAARSFLWFQAVWAYPVLASLALGTWAHARHSHGRAP